jgi:hypothetical protein
MTHAAPLLEIHCTWSGLTEVRHVEPNAGTLTLSSKIGWHWSLLGAELGWVPSQMAPALRCSPPMLSDVEPRRRGLFLVDEALAGGTDHEVWQLDDEGMRAHVPAAWSPEVTLDGHSTDLTTLLLSGRAQRSGAILTFELGPDMVLTFAIGPQLFRCAVVPRTKPLPPSTLQRDDRALLASISTMASLAAMLVLAVQFIQPTVTVSKLLMADLPNRRIILVVPPPAPTPKPKPLGPSGGGGGGGSTGKTVADGPTSGGSGLPNVLDMLNDSPLGGDGLSAELVALTGQLRAGTRAGIGLPTFGTRGPGWGGGPGAEGLGDGLDFGTPGGPGGGGPDLGGPKGIGTISAQPGEAITIGSLRSDQIDRVMRRNLSKFRYCYQRQLQRDPSLSGKITVRFTIDKKGQVSRAAIHSSAMNDEAVESCIKKQTFRLTFDEPAGGGIVIVKYPFMFSAG